MHNWYSAVSRVAIDALENECSHDARTQSPHLFAERLQLSVDARVDLEAKQRAQRGSSWLRIIRECTQQQQSVIMLGSDAWLEKNHVNRLGTSLRGQTRVNQRRLGCSRPGLSEMHSARLVVAPDTAAVVIDVDYDFRSPKTYRDPISHKNPVPNFD